jgi:hypothetical protein
LSMPFSFSRILWYHDQSWIVKSCLSNIARFSSHLMWSPRSAMLLMLVNFRFWRSVLEYKFHLITEDHPMN